VSHQQRTLGLLALVLGLVATSPAGAKMVSGGDCRDLSHDCTCDDGAYLEVFLANQRDALAAWEDTQSDIIGGAAGTFEEARALFEQKFPGDPRVLSHLTACPDLNPKKVAGVSILGGGAELDDCFCKNVCKDIVESTISHERTHVAFNLLGISYIIGVGTACSADLTDPDFCKVSNALLLSESEIQAHRIGVETLQESLSTLKDPESPEMECTWEPLPDAPPPEAEAAAEPAPEGFLPRVRALLVRFVHGAG
jgi:hypothetical protein